MTHPRPISGRAAAQLARPEGTYTAPELRAAIDATHRETFPSEAAFEAWKARRNGPPREVSEAMTDYVLTGQYIDDDDDSPPDFCDRCGKRFREDETRQFTLSTEWLCERCYAKQTLADTDRALAMKYAMTDRLLTPCEDNTDVAHSNQDQRRRVEDHRPAVPVEGSRRELAFVRKGGVAREARSREVLRRLAIALAAGVVMAAAWFWMTKMADKAYRQTLGIEATNTEGRR